MQQALEANYGSQKAFEDPDMRLATLVVSRNIAFAHDLLTKGQTYAFQSRRANMHGSSGNSADKEKTAAPENQRPQKSHSAESHVSKSGSQPTPSRKVALCDSALQEVLHENVQIECSTGTGIIDWIGELYNDSRGFEIGTFNHHLLSTLMTRQSVKWPIMVRGYVSDIVVYVHTFLCKALLASCREKQLSSKIISFMMGELIKNYHRAICAADFLLDIERAGTPMTLNHYLNENLQKW